MNNSRLEEIKERLSSTTKGETTYQITLDAEPEKHLRRWKKMFEVVNDLPKWLIEYLENNTGFKRDGFAGYPYPTITSESEAVIEFYKFISKPENQANLPEVAKLIEACKLEYREIPDTIMGKGFKVGNLNAEKIKEALKPFQGGE